MEQTNQQPPMFNQQPGQQYAPQYAPQYQPQYQAPSPSMSFGEAIKTCFKKYFDFKGRARRSEYWWFILFEVLVTMVWMIVSSVLVAFLSATQNFGQGSVTELLTVTLSVVLLPLLVFVIPQYAATTRRLHDTGHSGWWVVLSLVVGAIYLFMYIYVIIPVMASISYDSDPQSMTMFEDMMSSSGMFIAVSICSMASMIIGIVIFIFTLLDSQRGANKYGPSPKYP